MDKLSYAVGMNIGKQLESLFGKDLQVEDFAQAVKDIISGNELALSETDASKIVTEAIHRKEEEKGRQASAEGEKFLEENGKTEGVVTLPSGLQYQVMQEGTGRKPKATDQVKCHYEGTLIDGTLFDSSLRRGEPAVFPLNGVIAGWTEGLQLMSEGAKYRFFIPYQLAYGSQGAGASIPPYSALIFDVELIQVL